MVRGWAKGWAQQRIPAMGTEKIRFSDSGQYDGGIRIGSQSKSPGIDYQQRIQRLKLRRDVKSMAEG